MNGSGAIYVSSDLSLSLLSQGANFNDRGKGVEGEGDSVGVTVHVS